MTGFDRLAELLRGLDPNRRAVALEWIEDDAPPQPEPSGEPMTKNDTTPTTAETKQLALRLPVELVARIEQHAARLRTATPGVRVTRADAARALLLEAVGEAERGGR